ncbi:PAS domain-containing sensor histidine kinase [Arcobacter peruensis]|uniref:PAS domain-containing sensor histidine kinase n=1 Tax=Arcobacter peruensis TaxID=2320140 RepID=UPI000F0847A8|nr:PAS domain-containing sensor histidine kinase [Arcobacter peruensis]
MNESDDNFFELNQIIDNTIEGILIIEDGFIKKVNKSLLEMLSYTNDDIIGNLATGILIPDVNEKYIKFNSKTFQEISLLTKNGNIVPCIIKIKDITIKQRELKMVSILDLRQMKEQEALLVEQSKFAAMGELLSMIAHQWRQPLTSLSSIILRLNLKIKTNTIDMNFFDKKLNSMNEQIQYLSNTIDDFSNFMLPNKKKEKVNLVQITSLAINLIKESFSLSNIEVIVKETPLNEIMIYKNEILQVLLNLLNNSKDAFISNNTKLAIIEIYFKEDELSQIIYIQDNAGGIKDEVMNNIYKPYFSTKEKKNGTGLGLYISKVIVEKHLNSSLELSNNKNGVLAKLVLQK